MRIRHLTRLVLALHILVSVIAATAFAEAHPAPVEHLFLDIPFFASPAACSDLLASNNLELAVEDAGEYQVATMANPADLQGYGDVSCVDFHFDTDGLQCIFLLYPNCDRDSVNACFEDAVQFVSSAYGAPTDAYLLEGDTYYGFPGAHGAPDIQSAINILHDAERIMSACVVFGNIEARVSVNNGIRDQNKYAVAISFYPSAIKPPIPAERPDYGAT